MEKSSGKSKVAFLFLLSTLLTAIYWLSGIFYNPYNSKLTGILFEILWLPMLLCLLVIPIFCLNKIIKKAENIYLYILSLFIALSTILFLIIK